MNFKSYLIEITGQILKKTDTDGQKLSLKSKGTGKWTSQNAMDIGTTTGCSSCNA
jgi:6-phosphogluconate dehydrogenase